MLYAKTSRDEYIDVEVAHANDDVSRASNTG